MCENVIVHFWNGDRKVVGNPLELSAIIGKLDLSEYDLSSPCTCPLDLKFIADSKGFVISKIDDFDFEYDPFDTHFYEIPNKGTADENSK